MFYSKMIKSMRAYYGVSQKKLANGLCSESLLSHMESGGKYLSKELRQRILDRMGVSFQGSISILKGKEYTDRQNRNKLITLLKEQQWDELKKHLDVLEDVFLVADPIDKQFYYDMLGQFYINNNNYTDAKCVYEKAVKCTMAGICKDNLHQFILAPIEYYYLIMYCYCSAVDNLLKSEMMSVFLSKIIESIEHNNIIESKKCGIYSFALIKYYDMVKDKEYKSDYYINSKTDIALEMLSKANLSYNLTDILLIKKSMVEISGVGEQGVYERRIQAINNIYKIAGINNNTYCNMFFLYDDITVDISKMIRKRRCSMGLTQHQLADGICSDKTLRRIEYGAVNCQNAVLHALLEKLNLSAEIQYDGLVTDDWNVLRTAYGYRKALRNRDYSQAKYLISCMDQNAEKNPQNKQIVLMRKAFVDYITNVINIETYLERLDKALSITLNVNEDYLKKDCYFTENEMHCLFYMAMSTENYKSTNLQEFFASVFDNDNCNDLSAELKALLLRWLSGRYAASGEYLLSNKYAKKALQIELENNKIRTAYKCLYDLAWNSVRAQKEDVFSERVYDWVLMCSVLADYIDDEASVEFFCDKLKDIVKKKDWTL